MCLLAEPGSIKVADKDIITHKIVDLYYGEEEKWRGHYYPHKSFDFDIVINEGGTPEYEMHLTYNKMYLEAGYQFGITNVCKDDDFSARSNALFVNFGVNF